MNEFAWKAITKISVALITTIPLCIFLWPKKNSKPFTITINPKKTDICETTNTEEEITANE